MYWGWSSWPSVCATPEASRVVAGFYINLINQTQENMKKTKRQINEYDEVKAYFYGTTIELTNGVGPKEPKTKVIKGHRYVVLETGEINNMNRESEKRTDNLDSVRRTMKGLRRLIGANFVSNKINRKDQLWITLTYREDVNATDKNSPEVVYKDFKRFIRKLREKYNPTIEYIAILEPQASGRWHLHVLMKTLDHSKLYIPNSNIEKLWGRGFTSTKRLKNSDNVSAYVMAYVSNVEIELKSSDILTKANVHPVYGDIFSLTQTKEAMDKVAKGHNKGKILLKIN